MSAYSLFRIAGGWIGAICIGIISYDLTSDGALFSTAWWYSSAVLLMAIAIGVPVLMLALLIFKPAYKAARVIFDFWDEFVMRHPRISSLRDRMRDRKEARRQAVEKRRHAQLEACRARRSENLSRIARRVKAEREIQN